MYIYFSCMLLILFCHAAPGWAYIDPGTGSVVFSALAYIIGAGAVAFGFLFRPIVHFDRKQIQIPQRKPGGINEAPRPKGRGRGEQAGHTQ